MRQRIMMRKAGKPAQRPVRNQGRRWQAHSQGSRHITPEERSLPRDAADDPGGGTGSLRAGRARRAGHAAIEGRKAVAT